MNVLIVAPSMIPSTVLCGHSQLEYLKKISLVDYRYVSSPNISIKDINWSDIIVFIRCDSELDVYVSKLAKQNRKHTIYVLDDDLFNVPTYISSSPHFNSAEVKGCMMKIMNNCKTLLSPSSLLIEKYGKNFLWAFKIEEPSLIHEIAPSENKRIKIGFAGSLDRTKDIDVEIESALRRIYKEYGDQVSIEFMGSKPAMVDDLGLKYYHYQDSYLKYVEQMSNAKWDIGLAPMPETEFHSCKYCNKYVEYSSFGIVGVFSNCEPYRGVINNYQNGVLVENSEEGWYCGISELIQNVNLRQIIKANCISDCQQNYSLEKLAMCYYDYISTGFIPSSQLIKDWFLPFQKLITLIKRAKRKILEQRANTPKWLYKKIKSRLFRNKTIFK